MPETKPKPSPYTKPPRVELLARDGGACKTAESSDQAAEAGRVSVKHRTPAPAPAPAKKEGAKS